MDAFALRRLRETDAPDVIAILRDEEVAKTFMLPDLADDEAAGKLFYRLLALSAGEDVYVRCAQVQGRVVGFINQVDARDDTVEVGYAVASAMWNRGVATAMLCAAMEELFARGFNAVRAGHFEGNAASRRVMIKSGMQPIDHTDEVTYRGQIHRCHFMEKRP